MIKTFKQPTIISLALILFIFIFNLSGLLLFCLSLLCIAHYGLNKQPDGRAIIKPYAVHIGTFGIASCVLGAYWLLELMTFDSFYFYWFFKVLSITVLGSALSLITLQALITDQDEKIELHTIVNNIFPYAAGFGVFSIFFML
ncbi:MAG: hypothetical protein HN790_16385 [Methylococcales bacterium]|nr:hypothetical protein [Methylococcales bacterium]